ncbi:Importin Subunit Alpha-5 [Manis pentadactyla]|nr:Importin Subunit Alpha-5 [Manis pentadactyla]
MIARSKFDQRSGTSDNNSQIHNTSLSPGAVVSYDSLSAVWFTVAGRELKHTDVRREATLSNNNFPSD